MLGLIAAPTAFTPAACAYDSNSPGCLRVRSWFSPRCASYWSNAADAPPCDDARQWHCGSKRHPDPLRQQTNRTAVPLSLALEDFCEYAHGAGVGRVGVHPTHMATEISVLSDQRMVFVDNKKAGSTTIANLIRDHFFPDNPKRFDTLGRVGSKGSTTCDGAANDNRGSYCAIYSMKACSTICLSPPTLESHVIFAFVRDPVERFWSALATAAAIGSGPAGFVPELTFQGIASFLVGMRAGTCGFGPHRSRCNGHLETQALALSSAAMWRPVNGSSSNWLVGGHRLPLSDVDRYMVPLDFIGRIEHLATDFLELLEVVTFATGRPPLNPAARSVLEAQLLAGVTNMSAFSKTNQRSSAGKSIEQRLRNASLDALIREAYAQDIACGFSAAGSGAVAGVAVEAGAAWGAAGARAAASLHHHRHQKWPSAPPPAPPPNPPSARMGILALQEKQKRKQQLEAELRELNIEIGAELAAVEESVKQGAGSGGHV